MRTSPFLLGALAACGLLAMAAPVHGIDRIDLQESTPSDTTMPSAPVMPALPTGPDIPGIAPAAATTIPAADDTASQDGLLPPLTPPPWARNQNVGSSTNLPVPTVPGASGGIKTPKIISPSDFKKPRISQPQFEEDYRRWMLQEQNKRAQRKRLGESIMDEIKRYGLLILLGFVAILVLFALKKESAPLPPASGTGGADNAAPDNKDIWKDEF